MNRRRFLAAASATSLSGWVQAAAPDRRAFVGSDVDPLKRVLLLPPSQDDRRAIPDWAEMHDPVPAAEVGERSDQYRRFAELISGGCPDVLMLDRLLDEAIIHCRKAGRLAKWVFRTVPSLSGREAEITADLLLSEAGSPVEALMDEEISPVPLRSMFFTRDIASMTPRGLILGNFVNDDRASEVSLLRFALSWAPALKGYPIAFDAAKAQVYLQGGDVITVDEKTLLIGVGNLTDKSAAQQLARSLKIDVVSIQLPGAAVRRSGRISATPWDSLRTQFLHLDTVLGLVGRRMCVTLPYVFEAKYGERIPLRTLAEGFQLAGEEEPEDIVDLMAKLKECGRVRRFAAGSGAPDRGVEGMKIIDYLRSIGYEPQYVGGPPPPVVDREFLRERVIPELDHQAANVVALKPGRVVAYSGNDHTLAGLRAAGVDVQTFRGTSLSQWRGGPHCMTLPLERG